MIDRGPFLRVLVVGANGSPSRLVSAKEVDMIFVPTVGLYKAETKVRRIEHCMDEERAPI